MAILGQCSGVLTAQAQWLQLAPTSRDCHAWFEGLQGSFDERTLDLVQTLGLEFSIATAVQQVLLELCKPIKQPSRIVGNGFDMGVRWAVAYPRLAEDFISSTNRMYELQGVDREQVVRAITRGVWELFLNSGAFDTPGGDQVRDALIKRIENRTT